MDWGPSRRHANVKATHTPGRTKVRSYIQKSLHVRPLHPVGKLAPNKKPQIKKHPPGPLSQTSPKDVPPLPKDVPPLPSPTGQYKAVHVGFSCSSLSLSPDQQYMAVGGREMKILKFNRDKGWIVTKTGRGGKRFAVWVGSIAWHPKDPYICTVPTNGQILIYKYNPLGNISKLDLYKNLRGHDQVVNRVCWHSKKDHLLSASKDGYLHLWDVSRNKKEVKIQTYYDCRFHRPVGLRDVQINPNKPEEFCAVDEDGSIHFWDFGRPLEPTFTIQGHQGFIKSVAWHPEFPSILATGGRSNVIKIWDTRKDKNCAAHIIEHPRNVHCLKWRPGNKYQIASSASNLDLAINVWDVMRPYIPLVSFHGHDDTVTEFVWPNSKTLILCSKDYKIKQHDIDKARFPYKHLRGNGITWSPTGHFAMFTEKIITGNIHVDDNFISDFGNFKEKSHFTQKRNSMSKRGKKKSITNRNLMGNKNGYLYLVQGPSIKPSYPMSCSVDPDSVPNTDHGVIKYLAQEYCKKGNTLSEKCRHNAMAAKNMNRSMDAHMWLIIELLYGNVLGLPLDTPRYSKKIDTKGSIETSIGKFVDVSEEDIEGDIEGDTDGENEGDNEGDHEGDSDDALDKQLIEDKKGTGWSKKVDIVKNAEKDDNKSLLRRFNECIPYVPKQAASRIDFSAPMRGCKDSFRDRFVYNCLEKATTNGDVQTCVAVVLVLRNVIKFDPEKTRRWFSSYMELLRQLELFNEAAIIARLSSDATLREVNQKSTTMKIKCPHCKNKSDDPGTFCRNNRSGKLCNKIISKCSVCWQKVSGLYVWCQGCGHGGHMEHMREWFSKHYLCPTGCLHRCIKDLTSSNPMKQRFRLK